MAEHHGLCGYCAQNLPLELEHIEPLATGGAHDPSNATAACRKCNASKGSKSLLLWLYQTLIK